MPKGKETEESGRLLASVSKKLLDRSIDELCLLLDRIRPMQLIELYLKFLTPYVVECH